MFSVNDRGGEHIIRFGLEDGWIYDYESYNLDIPTVYFIEALEDSEILVVSKGEYSFLQKLVPAVDVVNRKNDINNVIDSQKRIHASISMTAEDKYRSLISTFPSLINRIPQAMIASYLGMTPATLSRIRKVLLHRD